MNWRNAQVNLKNAYTKITLSTSSFSSHCARVVLAANGRARTISMALSVDPSVTWRGSPPNAPRDMGLAGGAITDVRAHAVGGSPSDGIREDKAVITLSFAEGSIGTIHYLANGHRSFPKERLEVFCGGRILALDNFRNLSGYGWKGFRGDRLWRQDKGHAAEVRAFIAAVEKGGPSPIPFDELVEVTRTTFRISDMLRGR